MQFTEKQSGVLKGVGFGLLMAIAIIVMGVWFNPFSFSDNLNEMERLSIALQCSLIPTFFLAISIGRLAKHRFFTPEDIDGGGLSHGSDEARVLQSLLQNTLEQFALAFVIYLSWSLMMPANWLSVVPLAAIAFAIGRVMFFVGYKHGAPSRAIGFTLAFYPSLMMMICIIGKFISQHIS